MRNVCFVILALALAGCVSTTTTGFVDPQYRSYKVSSVVVRAKGATMEEAFAAEQKFAEKFDAHNIKVIKFTDLAPPTRNYTVEQEARLLKKSGADSIFTVYVAGRDSIERYVPPTYHAGQTTSYVNKIGNIAYVSTYTTPGYTTGGYSTSKPIMAIFSSLIDLRNGNNIWQAEGRSSGGESSSYLDLLLDAGDSAIEDIINKGLIPEVSGKE
jgi:hypothetical protein